MRRVSPVVRAIAALVAAWAVRVAFFESYRVFHAGYEWFEAAYGGVGARLFVSVWDATYWGFSSMTDVATLGVGAAFLARYLARSWGQQGYGDVLARPRRWVGAHPRLVAIGAALLSVAWFATRPEVTGLLVEPYRIVNGLWAILGAWGLVRGVRAVVAPIDLGPTGEAPVPLAIADDEITFGAVAVTRRTRAAVEAMAAVSVLAVAAMTALPVRVLWRAETFLGVAIYAALASGAAFAFRRASRIGVGIDGVRVHGTSREQFFAYRDLDDARLAGGATLELLRRGKVILSLQIHGDDALRRDAIRARIVERIAASRDARAAGAARLVEGKSRAEVVRAASGGADYRAPALTAEQLWSLVEGPTADAATRTAAAEALAATMSAADRPRLRVAATVCADPQTRAALEQLADEGAEATSAGPTEPRVVAVR